MVNIRRIAPTDDSDCDPPASDAEYTEAVGNDAIVFVGDQVLKDVSCFDERTPDNDYLKASCWYSDTVRMAARMAAMLFSLSLGGDLLAIVPGWIIIRETRTLNGSLTDWNELAHNGECNMLEHAIAHEAGHALGLGGYSPSREHPNLTHSSLMSTNYVGATDPTPYCEPQAYDVAALMGNYQSR